MAMKLDSFKRKSIVGNSKIWRGIFLAEKKILESFGHNYVTTTNTPTISVSLDSLELSAAP